MTPSNARAGAAGPQPAAEPNGPPASGPRRILHVTEAPLGGVISCLEELLRGQVARDDVERVEVVTPEINRDALGGIESPRLRLTTLAYDRGSPRSLIRLARLTVSRVRATRPDVLHVHSTIAGAVVRACRPLMPASTRIVYCPHGWAFSREGSAIKNRAIGLVERALSHASDRIVCVSAYEKRDAAAAGIAERRMVVVENGISPRPLAALAGRARADGRKVVVFAGRFDRQKGFDTYVEVLRRLGDEARGVAIGRAIVSGDAPAEMPPNVEILGWQPRDRVFELYAQADLLLMPSRWEGFPLVALEAMQARLAVFAGRVGGLQDIVVEGRTGRLFAPDDVGAIVALVREASVDELRAWGEEGHRRYLRLYTAERMNQGIWDLYRGLPRAPRGRLPN